MTGNEMPELPDGWKVIIDQTDKAPPMAVRLVSEITKDGVVVNIDLGFIHANEIGAVLRGNGYKIPAGQFLDLAAMFQDQAQQFINIIGER